MENIIEIAKAYAQKSHGETNHLYNGFPYADTHLVMVVDFSKKYLHLIPEEYKNLVIASCWTHDVIEDCRCTYNDVKKSCGEFVADITYSLTNEKGKTRKERANRKYYVGIQTTQFATFVKICDRLANVTYSKTSKSSMFKKYQNEEIEFRNYLYCDKYAEMFLELENLLKNN